MLGFEHFSLQIRDIEKNCLLIDNLHVRLIFDLGKKK
jgi:hypothetical protein